MPALPARSPPRTRRTRVLARSRHSARGEEKKEGKKEKKRGRACICDNATGGGGLQDLNALAAHWRTRGVMGVAPPA